MTTDPGTVYDANSVVKITLPSPPQGAPGYVVYRKVHSSSLPWWFPHCLSRFVPRPWQPWRNTDRYQRIGEGVYHGPAVLTFPEETNQRDIGISSVEIWDIIEGLRDGNE